MSNLQTQEGGKATKDLRAQDIFLLETCAYCWRLRIPQLIAFPDFWTVSEKLFPEKDWGISFIRNDEKEIVGLNLIAKRFNGEIAATYTRITPIPTPINYPF